MLLLDASIIFGNLLKLGGVSVPISLQIVVSSFYNAKNTIQLTAQVGNVLFHAT